MIQINRKEDCCGCTACYSICPKNAITMQVDDMGFKYPVIDTDLCVDCGLCDKVCDFRHPVSAQLQQRYLQPLVYMVRHKDMQEVQTSRSGAMFIALSDYLFQQGGVVYGVGYSDHFKVVHKRVTNKKECLELKGSKYVQSDLTTVFRQVLQDLKADIPVLFSGTPCQTAGLDSFIPSKYKTNLYLCDIVCHGTPSPFIWNDYLNYWEKKKGLPVSVVDFRDKTKGWKAHFESFVFADQSKVIVRTFTDLFYKHLMFRPSCRVCRYTDTRRPSDITIADFWGWQKVDPEFNADDKGCSLVLVQTDKGKRLFDMVSLDLNFREAPLEKCLQPNLQYPSVFSEQYDVFWKDYREKGFVYVARRYGDLGLWAQAKLLLKRVYRKVKRK